MYDLVLRDATLVSSAGREVADVAIRDGKIAYVGPRPPRGGREEISAMGRFLMPGVIDTAVQFAPNSDPTVWERESRAALSGGVTTVLALPDGDHPVTNAHTAGARAKAAVGKSWVDFGLWGRANLDDVGPIVDAASRGLLLGVLAGVPDHGFDNGRLDALRALLALSTVLGIDPEGDVDDEILAVKAMLQAARAHGRLVHLVHLSTAAELQLLDPVLGDLPVTAGVTPHHLFLSVESLEGDAGRVVTRPPVRPEHDRRSLWTAVRRGRLDCLASDHHPDGMSAGIPSSELLFPLMHCAVQHGKLALESLVSLCSEAPARIFGLEGKGRIAKGFEADLVLFAEGELSKVRSETLLSAVGWSPYEDREVAPKPELVLQRGRIVARRGEVVGDAPRGIHLHRA